jgi:peptidoglycan hydrolase-like protein with peptidoglycan-binding domain
VRLQACCALAVLAFAAPATAQPSNGGTVAPDGPAPVAPPPGDTRPPAGDAGPALGSRTLRRGMRGPDVRALQRALRALGFHATPDGAFGARTLRTVKRYERRHDFVVDGVVDPDEGQRIADEAGMGGGDDATGSADVGATNGAQVTLNGDGTATAPAGAPPAVEQIVVAGNQIAQTPYAYGGGHTDDFQDSAYDCSGSVSYALHGAGLLGAPLDSGELMSWGDPGPGQWVTIYSNEGHVFMVVGGLRFDTSGAADAGSRWQATPRSTNGYEVRHPPGL